MLKYLYMWEYAQINWFLKEGLVLLVCATSDEQISGEQFFLNKKNKKKSLHAQKNGQKLSLHLNYLKNLRRYAICADG